MFKLTILTNERADDDTLGHTMFVSVSKAKAETEFRIITIISTEKFQMKHQDDIKRKATMQKKASADFFLEIHL